MPVPNNRVQLLMGIPCPNLMTVSDCVRMMLLGYPTYLLSTTLSLPFLLLQREKSLRSRVIFYYDLLLTFNSRAAIPRICYDPVTPTTDGN